MLSTHVNSKDFNILNNGVLLWFPFSFLINLLSEVKHLFMCLVSYTLWNVLFTSIAHFSTRFFIN